MPLQIAPFTPPRRQDLTPQNLAALPKTGPPDMVEANMKGIAGLGTAFEGAYARARERGAMDQLSEYYKTHPFADVSTGGGGGGVAGNPLADQPAAGAGATSFKGKPEDGLKIYQGLVDRGIHPLVAAGMAGNVYTESRFNPGAVGDKGTAYGYAQWRGSRQQGLFAAAQQRGTDWRDPEAQLDHMAAELKGPVYGRYARAAEASGNPGAATAILARGYERPAEWALRKTLGERTGAAQSIFALGQQGGGGPPPVAAAGAPPPMPPQRPGAAAAPSPVVGGGVSRPPPVGLPPPDPTPDNIANAKAIMQQPTSDPQLKAWATQVIQGAGGAAGQVPTAAAQQPAPGANPASLQLQTGQFTIPSTGEVVPAGSGPDRLNAGAPRPQQVNVGEDGNPAPPAPAAAQSVPPLPPPDPRRVAAAANAPAPGAVPAQFRPSGGDSTYAATADYEGAVRAGLLPPPRGGVPAGPAPGPAGGGPAATGSVAPPGAAVPPGAPAGSDPRLAAAQAAGSSKANEFVEGIASELVKRGMDPKEARVRAAGATWDDKGFRLGPYPNPAAEAAVGGAGPAPAASPAAGGGGGANAPAAVPGGGAPPAAAGGAPQRAPGTFRANEALAIAARGDPQVFAAMLRQYGTGTGSGEWTLEHDGQGNWVKMNKLTGETVPLSQAQGGGVRQDLILPAGDPRRANYPGIPNDNKTYRVHPTTSGIDIQPVDEREAKTFEHQSQLAQQFEGNQTVKNFRALTDATGSMRASFAENTAAGDINGVIQVLKAIDPGSTVTQNEQGMIVASGGLPGWASGAVARLNGGAPLTPQMRADFVNASDAQHRFRWNQTKTIVEQTRNTAKANGLDPGAATNGFTDPVFPEKKATAKDFGGRDAAPDLGPPGKTAANPIPVKDASEALNYPVGTFVRIPGKGIQQVQE